MEIIMRLPDILAQAFSISTISQGLLWSMMALGVYLTYRVLDIADLTVEGSFPLGAAVAASLIDGGRNPYFALLMATIAGMLAGVVTGLLHTKLKIPALLAGILSMIALYSINLHVMGKANVSLLRMDTVYTPFMNMGLGKNYAILAAGLVFTIFFIIVLYWFFGTEIGAAIRATGYNQQMIRAQGVNTDVTIILGLLLSNGLVAFSGALIAQNNGFADVGMGTGTIVIGLASVIIGEVLGEAIFRKHLNFFGRLTFVVLGGVIYYIVIAFVLGCGMNPNDLKLFTAIIVAIALSMPLLKKKIKSAMASAKEAN